MKLINPKAEYLPQSSGIEGVYKQIELAGRTCYKSEDKITKDSAKPFVDRMIKSKHTAMLEHGTVYLQIPRCVRCKKMIRAPYSRLFIGPRDYYVTTNLKVIYEHNLQEFLRYTCDHTKFHERRHTFRLTTDRGVSHELVRHRVFSFAQESQRYCSYDRGKFGGELTFVMPSWYSEAKYDSFTLNSLDSHLIDIESLYLWMREKDFQPQEARAILPNMIKTEIIMTGFESDWRYFFDLRLFGKTGKPHPDMLKLAELMKEEAERTGIWDNIINQPSKFK